MRASEELNNVGVKATGPRLRVLQVFHAHERRHLSAEDVYKRIAQENGDVGLATIYRVLGQLTDVGILVRSVFDADSGKAVYEIHRGKHHDHLICLECGRVDRHHGSGAREARTVDVGLHGTRHGAVGIGHRLAPSRSHCEPA